MQNIYKIKKFGDKYLLLGVTLTEIKGWKYLRYSKGEDLNLEINYLKFSFFNYNYVLNFDKASLLFPLLCFVVLIVSCNMSDGINLQSFLFNFVNFLAIYIIKENLLVL